MSRWDRAGLCLRTLPERQGELLTEGRLMIRTFGPDVIVARVRGGSAREYLVTRDPTGWHCQCDALGPCSHILATQLVVLEPDHRQG
jgi:hypothetical protein